MSTVLLYQLDPYLKMINAVITNLFQENALVELNQTIIYPGGGGQVADRGMINGSPVTPVIQENGQLSYKTSSEVFSNLRVGEEVMIEIDWEFRHRMMRLHTAQHVLAAVIVNRLETRIAGNYIDPENSHVDFQTEKNFTDGECRDVEGEINRIVARDLPVEVMMLAQEEAKQVLDPKRVRFDRLPGISKLRLIKIGELDITACGGTHVKRTSEIGEFRIQRFKSKGKNRKRFYFEVLD